MINLKLYPATIEDIRMINNQSGIENPGYYTSFIELSLAHSLISQVAKIRNQSVGYFILNEALNHSLRLSFLMVIKEEQRKGIGSALLKKAMEIAKSYNKKTLKLSCYRTNIDFYKKFKGKVKQYGREGNEQYDVTYSLEPHVT